MTETASERKPNSFLEEKRRKFLFFFSPLQIMGNYPTHSVWKWCCSMCLAFIISRATFSIIEYYPFWARLFHNYCFLTWGYNIPNLMAFLQAIVGQKTTILILGCYSQAGSSTLSLQQRIMIPKNHMKRKRFPISNMLMAGS